jgi:hypothetical protein
VNNKLNWPALMACPIWMFPRIGIRSLLVNAEHEPCGEIRSLAYFISGFIIYETILV